MNKIKYIKPTMRTHFIEDRNEIDARGEALLIDQRSGGKIDDGELAARGLRDHREELVDEELTVDARGDRIALALGQRLRNDREALERVEHAEADHVHALRALERANRHADGRLRARKDAGAGGDDRDRGQCAEDPSFARLLLHHEPFGRVG